MKLEVGMYVRTVKGLLGKLLSKEKDGCGFILKYEGQYNKKVWSSLGTDSEITKASFNIIDLIEVGDYVNGHLVTATYNPNGDEMYHISLQNGKDYILIHNDDEIKSILTHEQYEANCYKEE